MPSEPASHRATPEPQSQSGSARSRTPGNLATAPALTPTLCPREREASKRPAAPRPAGKRSKLDAYAAELDQWFEKEEVTLAVAQERLQGRGCAVSLARLSGWRRARLHQQIREQLLAQIAAGARQCNEVERGLSQDPRPMLETLIKLHRMLIMKLSLEAETAPAMLRWIKELMKPVLDWARLNEQHEAREAAEHRAELAAQKAAEPEVNEADKALRPNTVQHIERELSLL